MSRTCSWCEQPAPDYPEPCPTCTAALPQRPVPEDGDERAAEMERIGARLEVAFDVAHGRIEALVGRPVWTHEMGLNWPGLVEEARTQDRPGMDQIIELIPPEKRLVVEVEATPG